MMVQNKIPLNLSNVEFTERPFPHFISFDVFPYHLSLMLLDWLKKNAIWKKVVTDFYEQYEFNLRHVKVLSQLSFLIEQNFLHYLRIKMGQIFGVKFGNQVDVTVHKLVVGQQIEVHNDYIPGEETHRLLIHLNHGWKEENGGALIFYNGENSLNISKQLLPIHNSAVGFAISAESYHAVAAIQKGERFTIVFSLYKIT